MVKTIFDLYLANKDNTARYYLGTRGKNPLIFIGLNPSTANSEKSDRTITKVRNFAKNFGYDSFIMLNLYPLRSTDPNKLPLRHNPRLHNENIKIIKRLLKNYNQPAIVGCWGTKIITRPYLVTCYQEIFKSIEPIVGNVYSLGELTEHGHPRHPGRIGYECNLNELSVYNY